MNELTKAINVLGCFCGARDVAELTLTALRANCGTDAADVMVLFGGSVLAGGDVLAGAMRAGVARLYMIVGGEGHTTPDLRRAVHALWPDVDTARMAESEVFSVYLSRRYGLLPDIIETRSTNCGNNITNMLRLLEEQGVRCNSFILAQDATMQRRMEAGLRLHRPDALIINYAAYAARMDETAAELRYEGEPINGMWTPQRYLDLLMGEIPRLTDDPAGYGPKGRGFIAHVDVPSEVRQAYEFIKARLPEAGRAADPRFAQARV